MPSIETEKARLAAKLTEFGFRSRVELESTTPLEYALIPVVPEQIQLGSALGELGDTGKAAWSAQLYRRNNADDAHEVTSFIPFSRIPVLLRMNILSCEPAGFRRWEITQAAQIVHTETERSKVPPPAPLPPPKTKNIIPPDGSTVVEFLTLQCIKDPRGMEKATPFFGLYQQWCRTHQAVPVSNKVFKQFCVAEGIRAIHRETGNFYVGVRYVGC